MHIERRNVPNQQIDSRRSLNQSMVADSSSPKLTGIRRKTRLARSLPETISAAQRNLSSVRIDVYVYWAVKASESRHRIALLFVRSIAIDTKCHLQLI